jgi:hypothetical protein
MSQRFSMSLIVGTALLAGGAIAWSQWQDMKASEPVIAPAPPPKGAHVLNPATFVGQAAVGYTAAQACPQMLAQLFCYCGCDETDKHSSLLDCFTTDHGADCPICTEEAVIAARMKKEGKSIAQVQQAIDKKFSTQYPFEKPSMQLVRYKAKAEGMQANMMESAAEKPKLKPGAKAGDCCGGAKKVQ